MTIHGTETAWKRVIQNKNDRRSWQIFCDKRAYPIRYYLRSMSR